MRAMVRFAVAGALLAAVGTAYADVDLPNGGNGEVILFVRDANNAARVYARGTGVSLDSIRTQATIQGDSATANSGVPIQISFSLPNLTHDQNLTDFLSAGGTYVWGLMAGDTTFNTDSFEIGGL